VGRVGMCMLCTGDSDEREDGMGVSVGGYTYTLIHISRWVVYHYLSTYQGSTFVITNTITIKSCSL
jgi:hypothetical protein